MNYNPWYHVTRLCHLVEFRPEPPLLWPQTSEQIHWLRWPFIIFRICWLDCGAPSRPVDAEDATVGFDDCFIRLRTIWDLCRAVYGNAAQQASLVGLGSRYYILQFQFELLLILLVFQEEVLHVWNLAIPNARVDELRRYDSRSCGKGAEKLLSSNHLRGREVSTSGRILDDQNTKLP